VGAPDRRRSCSRGGWILFRAECEYNCEFNGNGKFNCNCDCNDNCKSDCNRNDKFKGNCNGKFNGDGEPGGVEGAASYGGGV
jgi:hypothetical protein